jgi:hypothetical protein
LDTSNSQVLIYTPVITARVSYAVSLFFDGKAALVSSLEEFATYDGPRINYSADSINGSFHVIPYGLLADGTIHQQDISCFEWEGLKVFFGTGGDIPFDIFSASFYLLSRYEEYLPHEKDIYGRYAHTNSLAYKEGFLTIPLVNYWMQVFQTVLDNYFPGYGIKVSGSRFRFLPTYDVDIAYAYNHQPVWKNVVGFYRDLILARMDKVTERANVYSGKKADPFDTFSWLDELHAKYRLQPVYFFLTILKRGEYDKNLPAGSKALQRLYNKLASIYVTGLHPSWQSGTDESLLLKEKQALEKIVKHTVFISRNHYLRFTIPHTYRRLIAAGITDDHSMAYGTINGFRASYTMPYRWYDLEKDQNSHLVIHPFCFMEASSFFEQGYTAEQAAEEIQYYHDTVKNVNGQFITLFHNHFLTEQPEWIGWRKMYENFLQINFG